MDKLALIIDVLAILGAATVVGLLAAVLTIRAPDRKI